MKPLVSICIPTYNGETYISEAFQSAIQQTLTFRHRDQLSLAYTVYQLKLGISLIPGDILDNGYSKYHLHTHQNHEEKHKVMNYNFWIFKKLSFFSVKLMRKLKKLR